MLHRRSEQSELLAAAQPALEQAQLLLAEASSMVILTDPSGVIIETAGDSRTIDGELLGILDISGLAKTFNPQSLALACAVGRQIEEIYQVHLSRDELSSTA